MIQLKRDNAVCYCWRYNDEESINDNEHLIVRIAFAREYWKTFFKTFEQANRNYTDIFMKLTMIPPNNPVHDLDSSNFYEEIPISYESIIFKYQAQLSYPLFNIDDDNKLIEVFYNDSFFVKVKELIVEVDKAPIIDAFNLEIEVLFKEEKVKSRLMFFAAGEGRIVFSG